MQKKYILFISTILLVGCGGGSDGGTIEPTDENVTMEINKAYTIYPGNKLVKNSDLAQITISHTDGETTSAVTLTSGTATIIRQP